MAGNTAKVFVDTDVCIDLLSGREPFNAVAERLFTLADKGKINVCVSALSFSNMDYVLRSQYSAVQSKQVIGRFGTLVSVLPVDSRVIDLAIASDFGDFEDAIQYHSALTHGITTIITRNIKDYKKASIKVVTPDTFLSKGF